MIKKIRKLVAQHLYKHTVPFHFERPIISITFDDFPVSALEQGGALLEQYRAYGTYYYCTGLANTDGAMGKIAGASDWRSCVERGHELACHTYDHVDCATLTPAHMRETIARNQAAARELALPVMRHFSYPFGQYNLAAKKIALEHYTSARSIDAGINRGNIDLGLLKAVQLYSRHGWTKWETHFKDLETKPGWLIFYTHDVSDTPSAYGCTPQELGAILKRARDNGFDILPVGAVIDRLLRPNM